MRIRKTRKNIETGGQTLSERSTDLMCEDLKFTSEGLTFTSQKQTFFAYLKGPK